MNGKQLLVAVFLLFIACFPAYAGRLITVPTPVMGDLIGADWHPTQDYALVVGEGIYKFQDNGSGYGLEIIPPYPPSVCNAVDWRPQGDYALIVSQDGYIYSCDGNSVVELPHSSTSTLTDVAFSPSGDRALIVGYSGSVLVYENGVFTDQYIGIAHMLMAVTWHPSGDFAYLMGAQSMSDMKIFRWENGIVTEECTHSYTPSDMDFHPTGQHSLVVGSWGKVGSYSLATGYQELETPFGQMAGNLRSADWSPTGDVALIVGSAGAYGMPGTQFLAEYNGAHFNIVRQKGTPESFEDTAWKSDSSAAVIVGQSGALMLYDAESKIMGDVKCDKEFYSSGDPLSLFLDLFNFGTWESVDIYITLNCGGTTLYWPTFSLAPVGMRANLNTGFNVDDYLLWQCKTPHVSSSIDITWEMRIFQAGYTDEDHLLSFSKQEIVLSP